MKQQLKYDREYTIRCILAITPVLETEMELKLLKTLKTNLQNIEKQLEVLP